MKRILYISYDGMTDPLGQSQVLPYLAGLSKAGYAITLISCEKPHRFQASRSTIDELCAAAGIDWQPIDYTSRPPVVSTLKDIRNIRRKAMEIYSRRPFDMVHCRSYVPALVGQWLKQKLGVAFLFDMRGFWADERVDGGLWDLKNPLFKTIYRFFKKKEIQFLEQADHTISLTENAREEILSWPHFQQGEKPGITVIPCCADLNLFDAGKVAAADKEALAAKLDIKPGDFVLSYLGSLGTWYLLDEMLHFFKILKQHLPGAKMLFITHDEHERIRSFAQEEGVAQDVIIHPAPRKEVPVLLSLSSYSIYFIKPAFSKKASSPTKQGEIMAMGIPAICNRGVGDLDEIAARYHIGLVVEDTGAEAFQNAAARIADAFLSGRELFDKVVIADGARQFYSLDEGVARYREVYRSILNPVATA